MTVPDRIYINKVHGQHPEDWDFTDGKYLTKKQLAAKVEYIRADLAALASTDAAQARVAALREAAEIARDFEANGVCGIQRCTGGMILKQILALIGEART